MRKIYVVGLGPGGSKDMTASALAAIEKSDTIVGYKVYTDLIEELIGDRQVLNSPMRQEVDRCRMAVEEAEKDKIVSMVCSGDAGVYGMAGLMFEVAEEMASDVEIEIVPGITAACSGAAVLGAPLIHDFAVISMSDLLTPMDLIEKRLRAAGEADFAICIYNPSSKKRHDYLERACQILLETRSPDNLCGWVRNIGREGQEFKLMTLAEMKDEKVDMFTTVFIGNSKTRLIKGRMVTPRGYKMKPDGAKVEQENDQ